MEQHKYFENPNRPTAALVTVICVTRNAALTLQRLINSVKQYKKNVVEFVIIDGCSTDNTLNVLNNNNETIDFWLSEPDRGIYDAMNKAVKYARGRWLIFLGSDDFLLPGFAHMLALLVNANTIYYGGVIFHDKPVSRKYSSYRLTKINICHQAILYPRSVFEKYQYDTNYKIYADFHLNIRCWHDHAFKFEFHDLILSQFTAGGFSGQTIDEAYERDKLKLFRQYLGFFNYLRHLNRVHTFWGMLALPFKTSKLKIK